MPRAIGEWKVCSKCKEKKHVSEFHRRNRTPDQLEYRCKSCIKEYNDTISEKRKESDKRSYYKNHERQLARHKRYRLEKAGKEVPQEILDILANKHVPMSPEEALQHDKDRHREYKRTVYRETHNRKNREYQQTDVGKQVGRLKSIRRRARVANTENTFTQEDYDFLIEFQKGKCGCCHKKFTVKLKAEIDHIVPVVDGGGLTLENTQLLCRSCNASKGVKTIRFIPELPKQ